MVKLNSLTHLAVLVLATTMSISVAGAASGEEQSPQPHSSSVTFSSPDTYTWTVPAGVQQITVDLYGAQGYDGSNGFSVQPGGKGGHLRATLPVNPGETLQINVGGQGTPGTGGYNGGAGGLPWSNGGGGASDIRTGNFTFRERKLVAGGGGGGGNYSRSNEGPTNIRGGDGSGTDKGLAGNGPTDAPDKIAKGGGQYCNEHGMRKYGSFGYGGDGGEYGGGGGSGWCGGDGGPWVGLSKYSQFGNGGGGGSGHASDDATNKFAETGTQPGDGKVTIEY